MLRQAEVKEIDISNGLWFQEGRIDLAGLRFPNPNEPTIDM